MCVPQLNVRFFSHIEPFASPRFLLHVYIRYDGRAVHCAGRGDAGRVWRVLVWGGAGGHG